MSQKCDICGKTPSVGRSISHSHRKSSKVWGTNVQKIRVRQASGAAKRMSVCTQCIKSDKIVKA